MPTSAQRHRPHGNRPAPAKRPNANARGYTHRWQQYAAGFLRRHPLCIECHASGRIKAAKVVDHVIPHRGDDGLFWSERNHQALCLSCHGRKSAKERLT